MDWARSLVTLHQDNLYPVMVESTLDIVLKYRMDMQYVKDSLSELFEKVGVKNKELPVG